MIFLAECWYRPPSWADSTAWSCPLSWKRTIFSRAAHVSGNLFLSSLSKHKVLQWWNNTSVPKSDHAVLYHQCVLQLYVLLAVEPLDVTSSLPSQVLGCASVSKRHPSQSRPQPSDSPFCPFCNPWERGAVQRDVNLSPFSPSHCLLNTWHPGYFILSQHFSHPSHKTHSYSYAHTHAVAQVSRGRTEGESCVTPQQPK